MPSQKRIYINTSIPYVNAAPHIGYALEVVQTDALSRFYREIGYDVYFAVGTDENAIKNVEAAEKEGVSTRQFVDRNSGAFLDLKNSLNLSFDQFIRTTSEKHIKGVHKLWQLCSKDIYKKTYKGLYCTGCETFYKDNEFKDNVCPDHNRKLEMIEEENYFFALSRYRKPLNALYQEGKINVYPTFRRDEMLKFINGDLEDFSISRPVLRTKGWGVPVPNDPSQMVYVWFDALGNYITALDFYRDGELFKKYWMENTNRINVIGKDITKFHLVYWPAMLLSAHLPLPTRIYVHGFITVEGKKMSKTLGNVVNPKDLVTQYGTDAARYYLLREIPPLDDGNYSHSRMEELYASDLANELGNLVSRITTLAHKDGISTAKEKPPTDAVYTKTHQALFEKFEFSKILELVWKEIKRYNKEIDEFAPWKKTDVQRKPFLEKLLYNIHIIGYRLLPFIPESAQKIIQASSGKVEKITPLFPRRSISV
ncbi:methionine--tRNA ligase [Candidatus Roizmanbacteria bacterium CG09_land_8_20_14_0_10_41_9]|uniref:Methionine--tRNA ligase n=1 Tax=Candidatus Roizmanbacteria bacterium CG09_land_8_20_14_0_10_41_9 TaxID=1974850 RepID=A0A2H0WVU4_9BACT|nr:MAG: methionine--tRNA ligase [Candidatus Roizmanbacteria bacterium CG09_land_8_20_14_0_10_41_9]